MKRQGAHFLDTEAGSPKLPSMLRSLLAGLLFVSGASAMAYQIVWQRMLATVLGVTIYATTIVLAGFMAGLALGSWLGGKGADRLRRPLLLFGAAEIGIAAIAPWADSASRWAQVVFAQSSDAALGLRMALSFGLLIIPTTLMGATLPAVVASLAAKDSANRSNIAWLYGWNTLGACVGALITGYVGIGRFGLSGSIEIAAVGNLIVGLIALVMAFRVSPVLVEAAIPQAAPPPITFEAHQRALRIAVTISGAVALGLEVIWFRMLLAYLPTTTYAFTTMLATVLFGIGIGSVVAASGRKARQGRESEGEYGGIGALFAATGALALISATLLAVTYSAGWRTSGLIQACILALLPATVAMGVSYPRILTAATRDPEHQASIVGNLGAWNLGGALFGSAFAGFWLVPVLGARGALAAVALVSVGTGLWLATRGGSGGLAARRPALVWAAAAGIALIFLPDPFEAARSRRHPGEELLWSEEGAQGTVAIHKGDRAQTILYINGAHQADDLLEMRGVHEKIGLSPLMMQEGPKRALVIGLAGGATPGALSLDTGVSVDIVELSPSVVRGSDFFKQVNRNVLQRPNVRLLLDDGRNYLLRTREKYDIITADLIQPFHAGAGLLYSTEYFKLCLAALRPQGVMVQWIGHPPEQQYKMILRTFLSVFPQVTLWNESFLVGSAGPINVSASAFARARSVPEWNSALEEAGIGTLDLLTALRTADTSALTAFGGVGPVLTDDRPLVEFFRSLPGTNRPLDLTPLSAAPKAP